MTTPLAPPTLVYALPPEFGQPWPQVVQTVEEYGESARITTSEWPVGGFRADPATELFVVPAADMASGAYLQEGYFHPHTDAEPGGEPDDWR